MGALGTGLSQSYQSGAHSNALASLLRNTPQGGGGGGLMPPAPGGLGGGLKALMGKVMGGPKTGFEGVNIGQFEAPSIGGLPTGPPGPGAGLYHEAPVAPGQGMMDSLKGMFGGGDEGATPIKTTLKSAMSGTGKLGAGGMWGMFGR
jgi:hypothetical protein